MLYGSSLLSHGMQAMVTMVEASQLLHQLRNETDRHHHSYVASLGLGLLAPCQTFVLRCILDLVPKLKPWLQQERN